MPTQRNTGSAARGRTQLKDAPARSTSRARRPRAATPTESAATEPTQKRAKDWKRRPSALDPTIDAAAGHKATQAQNELATA